MGQTASSTTPMPPPKGLLFLSVIGIVLFALALGTYFVSRLELGKWELPVALVFATAKATLIVLFFMHLWDEAGGTRAAVLITLTFLVLLGSLVIGDLGLRFKPTVPPGIIPIPEHPVPDALAPATFDMHPSQRGRERPDQGREGP